MESTKTSESVPEKSSTFFNYVFGFEKDAKDEILNTVQYALLAIIPVLLLLRLIENVIPTFNPSKNYLELLAESLGQLGMIVLGIWLIDRIIRYIPTYSKSEYTEFNFSFIVPLILMLATRDTMIGHKLDAFMDQILGTTSSRHDTIPEAKTDPQLLNPAQLGPPAPIATQQGGGNAPDQLIPNNRDLTRMPEQTMPEQKSPDFNSMYEHDNIEPMAANDALGGGGGFSSW
tara:strand:- start:3 stop:695 length:693 start_codon:yes stop_codon:yes gene_type:complete